LFKFLRQQKRANKNISFINSRLYNLGEFIWEERTKAEILPRVRHLPSKYKVHSENPTSSLWRCKSNFHRSIFCFHQAD
jgi:hypothetical protein